MSGPELVLLLAVWLFVFGLAPYLTWRRGGSAMRITAALLVTLVPYLGWIIGLVIAGTTRRHVANGVDAASASALGVPQVPTSSQVRRRGRWIAWVVLALVVPVAVAAGYYLGRQASASDNPSTSPTWIDRELRPTGIENRMTLHCTYHMPDGTVRIRDSVITVGLYDPFSRGASQECPSSP